MENIIIGLVGHKGSGKSHEMADLLKGCPRLVLFDTSGDDSNFSNLPNVISDPDELEDFFMEKGGNERFAARYIPRSDDDKGVIAELTDVSRLLYGHAEESGRSIVFGVEEAADLTQPGWLPPGFSRAVRRGRHVGLSILWNSQRMAHVSKDLTALSDIYFIGWTPEPRDRDALVERVGAEIADRAQHDLGPREFIVFGRQAYKEITKEEAVRALKRVNPEARAAVSPNAPVPERPVPWWERGPRFVIGSKK